MILCKLLGNEKYRISLESQDDEPCIRVYSKLTKKFYRFAVANSFATMTTNLKMYLANEAQILQKFAEAVINDGFSYTSEYLTFTRHLPPEIGKDDLPKMTKAFKNYHEEVMKERGVTPDA